MPNNTIFCKSSKFFDKSQNPFPFRKDVSRTDIHKKKQKLNKLHFSVLPQDQQNLAHKATREIS